jgi:hypothetical protein
VFGYYATRPVYRRLARGIDSDGIAAGVTVLLIVVPVLLLAIYAGSTSFGRPSRRPEAAFPRRLRSTPTSVRSRASSTTPGVVVPGEWIASVSPLDYPSSTSAALSRGS